MSALIPFPDISRELFSFDLFGIHIALRYYALAYILGIIIAWRLTVHALRKPRLWPADTPPISGEKLDDLVTWIILGIILGGRIGYVLFYNPSYFLENPSHIPMVWEGGMAFHGGFLGVVIAAWLFTLRHNIPKLPLTDAIALGVPWGLLLGRVANFINGELWGRPTDLPWAVAFPGAAAQDCPDITGICGRHPSQLYEAGLEGLLLGLLLLWLAFARNGFKAPGLVSGTFFLGYGAARFFVEFFRQADEQFISPENPMGYILHSGGYGITMGQLLSLPMILVGLYLLLRARRPTPA
ncbi:prolipoprotein diacylglyceryl transferase [Rhodalgimonas zhirmunskyi]|uniref:Phosphatidylglycerol--prolipoprotein diacylglyceryl transferase n=1 Tax=Rhodalgimonas zhirmunskyi TaxID=2964767 RepID=A0AAJ1UAK8_9RHOB|nr:prolipoprotein diacylglyceryl transferase [Rhodoalgimonas zhirmunskyi]MDQ2094905.1 prolipoprotein diacylglyceryl transferase [Rhodoalgimonas zhirmunskyi]